MAKNFNFSLQSQINCNNSFIKIPMQRYLVNCIATVTQDEKRLNREKQKGNAERNGHTLGFFRPVLIPPKNR